MIAHEETVVEETDSGCTECQACGLFESAQTYCIYPDQDMRSKTQGKPVCLVLYSHPWKMDDDTGIPLSGIRSGGKFLRSILNDMGSKWVLSSVVRCFAGGDPYKRANPKAAHIRNCVSAKLTELIETTQPAVIVALGTITMKAVLGKASPPSLSKGRGTAHYVEVGGRKIPVLLDEDPASAQRDDKADQRDQYYATFRKADEIAKHGYTRRTYKYHLLETVDEFTELVEGLGDKICLDFEFDVHPKLAGARTIWHPDAKPTLANIAEFVDERVKDPRTAEVSTYLVPSRFFTCHSHWKRLVQNREIVGHNLKVEWNSLYRFCGQVCPYEELDGLKLPNGKYKARDTLLRANAVDSGKRGISLKKLCVTGLGVEDWSVLLHTEIRDANQRIGQAYAEAEKIVTQRLKTYLKDMTERNRRKHREARSFLKRVRPKGSAMFGDASFATLCEYGAADAENNLRLDHLTEVVPPTEEPLAELHQRMLYVTTMIERNGLPVDMSYARKLRKTYRRRYKEIMATLFGFDAVRAVLRRDPKVKALVSSGKLDLTAMVKLMSPFRKTFLRDLAIETGVLDQVPVSPKKIPLVLRGELTREQCVEKADLSFEEEVLTDLCGGEDDTKEEHKLPSWAPWEEKTEVQKLWAYIYEFRQLFGIGTRSIKPVFDYTVDNFLRTDFRLTATEAEGDASEGGGTVTSRLASSNPNLNNIKKDNVIRRIFSADVYGPDWVLIESDYDRIEPVMLTVVARIKLWRKAFRNGWDLYKVIANEVYHQGVSLDGDPAEVHRRLEEHFSGKNKVLRENAKTRTLAIMYDESPAAFARRANISREEADEFFRNFSKKYPEIDKYKRRIRMQVRKRQQVRTWWGRKRLFKLPPKFWSNYRYKFGQECRKAINFPIQEMAASTMIWKAYEVMRWVRKKGWTHLVKEINIIHDALMFAVHKSIAAQFMRKVKQILEDTSTLPFADKFTIPLKTGYKIGWTWGDMREIKGDDYAAEVEKTFDLCMDYRQRAAERRRQKCSSLSKR